MKPIRRMPFETMQMEFEKGTPFPDKVVMTEETGDVTEIKFHKIKPGAKLKDSEFEFRPPKGVVLRERSVK